MAKRVTHITNSDGTSSTIVTTKHSMIGTVFVVLLGLGLMFSAGPVLGWIGVAVIVVCWIAVQANKNNAGKN
jgi:hypothetical protein